MAFNLLKFRSAIVGRFSTPGIVSRLLHIQVPNANQSFGNCEPRACLSTNILCPSTNLACLLTKPPMAVQWLRHSHNYRLKCVKKPFPRCTKRRIEKSKCYEDLKKARRIIKEAQKKMSGGMEKKRHCTHDPDDPLHPYSTFIHSEHCCNNPCPDAFPRFDDLYYEITDKTKVKYRRTWAKCKPPVREHYCCRFKDLPQFPPLGKRRKRGHNRKPQCRHVAFCGAKKKTRCPRITMPGCKGARFPPNCFKHIPPIECRKICAPHPSFSECRRMAPKRLHPRECNCLNIPPQCSIWETLKYKKSFGI